MSGILIFAEVDAGACCGRSSGNWRRLRAPCLSSVPGGVSIAVIGADVDEAARQAAGIGPELHVIDDERLGEPLAGGACGGADPVVRPT